MAVIGDDAPPDAVAAVERMMLIENQGFVSGGSTSWWARASGIPQRDVFALAELAPPGSEGALFLPTLSGSTAPRWNDQWRAPPRS
jgi:xylulokinase